MDHQLLIDVRDVSRYYGERCAVERVTLRLRRGEALGLLGPNGAGKSTTMAMLAGVLAPHGGCIRVNGIDLLERPRAAKAHIGYLPEVAPLTREQTVDEYLGFCARLRGVARDRVAAACDTVKARCGLGEVGRRLIGSLSRGYQQRLGIAQAIVHEPAVVILDEPTAGLDPIQCREVRALLRELASDRGVIVSTHILPEVQAACERVAIIHEGRLVYDDAASGEEAAGVRIGLRHPPAVSELARLPEVAAVEMIAPNRFVLSPAGAHDLAAVISRTALERGWGLFELAPARPTLEELFIRLTCGEAAPGRQAT
jgi:ABC-2 type transport system ATP-binding protein